MLLRSTFQCAASLQTVAFGDVGFGPTIVAPTRPARRRQGKLRIADTVTAAAIVAAVWLIPPARCRPVLVPGTTFQSAAFFQAVASGEVGVGPAFVALTSPDRHWQGKLQIVDTFTAGTVVTAV